MQSSVEALQQLGVKLACQHVAEGRQDVETDQVLIPLAGGVLKIHYLEPLRDGLPNGDGCLGVPVFVDLTLKLGQRDIGRFLTGSGLHQVPALAGQGVDPGIHLGPEVPGRESLNVTAGAASATSHEQRVARLNPRMIPRLVR